TDNKFEGKKSFNDVWAAILFIVHLAAFVVLSVFMIRAINFRSFRNSNDGFGNYNTFIGLGSAGVVSGVLGLLYVFLMQLILIIISFWFSALLYLAIGAYYIYLRVYVVGVIMMVFAVIYAFLWFSWRSRIPFSTIMLKNVSLFTRHYPGTIFISFIFLVLSIAYTIYWAFTVIFIVVNGRTVQECKTNPALYAIYVFTAFSLYWTTQLLKDITHMTISGTFAADYFFPSSTSTASRYTSFASLGRALTTSFGSACFGSLLVAIVRLLKTLASQSRNGSDNMLCAFIACCAECILAQIEALLEYFNTYAYCYCAMYGLPYIPAGKATWNLIKDRGVEAIINDSLIGNVLGLGSVLISVISALVAYIVTSITQPNMDGGIITAVVIISFFIGLLVSSVIFQVIESANTSFFVCLAEDPQALASYNPELFESV
ncbi:DUF580-domain-containing protein, partial [Neoconidiobolus thromboides FSU 785]